MVVQEFESNKFGKIAEGSPSSQSIEILVCYGSPLLLRPRFAFLWQVFTQRGIKEDLIVSVQCPFGHLAVSVTG